MIIRDVAMVLAVVRSRVLRIKITNMTETRYRYGNMWSDIDSVESKMTPRLRAVEVGVIDTFEGIARIGLDSLDSC